MLGHGTRATGRRILIWFYLIWDLPGVCLLALSTYLSTYLLVRSHSFNLPCTGPAIRTRGAAAAYCQQAAAAAALYFPTLPSPLPPGTWAGLLLQLIICFLAGTDRYHDALTSALNTMSGPEIILS